MPSRQTVPRYITIQTGRSQYGVSSNTWYRLLAAGLVTAVKRGRRTLLDVESIESYFANLEAPRIKLSSRSGYELEALAAAPPTEPPAPPRRGRGRPRKHPIQVTSPPLQPVQEVPSSAREGGR